MKKNFICLIIILTSQISLSNVGSQYQKNNNMEDEDILKSDNTKIDPTEQLTPEEQLNKELALMDSASLQVQRKIATGELQTNAFGEYGGSSSKLSNFSYKNIKNGRYAEVAKEENWSKYVLPDNMEARYQRYLKEKKKDQNIIYISIFVLLSGFVIGGYFYQKNKIKNA